MIKVAVWGTGMMGQGLLGYILDRPKQIDLVGVIDRHPEKHGRTVGETIGCDCDIPVTADFAQVLALRPDVVCILTASNLHEIADQVEASVKAGANVIGIDWQTSLAAARALIPEGIGLQGNLAPTLIVEATPDVVANETRAVLEAMRGRAGHIFNLGHGLTPGAKLENIAALVETVRGFK